MDTLTIVLIVLVVILIVAVAALYFWLSSTVGFAFDILKIIFKR